MLTPVRKNIADYFDKGHIQLKILKALNQHRTSNRTTVTTKAT
jgi:hypothetical protein